jgi:hypothetical protein
MKNEGLEGVRLVARSQPQSRDLTCRVQEATTTKGGAFSFDKLCRDQSYVLSVPELNLHLSGGNTIIGGEQEAPGTHSAWRAPDGQGVFKLFGQKVLPVPTFSDVARDETLDGTPIVYPSMKPTGRVITIGEGQHLIISGKNEVKGQRLRALVPAPGRQRLASGFITDHVYIGVRLDGRGLEPVATEIDSKKVVDVLIRGEGVRFLAHDAVAPGRYALMADGDARVTIIDFGVSQVPQK